MQTGRAGKCACQCRLPLDRAELVQVRVQVPRVRRCSGNCATGSETPCTAVDFDGREPSDPANRSEYGLPPLPQPGPAPTPTPEPTPDCGCTKFDKVTVIGIAVPPGLRAQWLAWTLAEIAGRRIAQSVLQSVGVKSDPNVYAKPPKQSGLGEQKPDNAPPGTLGACRT